MSAIHLLAGGLLLTLSFFPQEASESKTYRGGLSPRGKPKYEALSTVTRLKGQPSETRVIDQVLNHQTDLAPLFLRNTDPRTMVFAGKIPSAVKENGKIVPAIVSQQWNTFRPVKSQVGHVVVNPGDPNVRATGFTCLIHRPDFNTGRAFKETTLHSKLIAGDEKGKVLMTFTSVIEDVGSGSFEYKYTATNSSDSPVEFEWAGFKEKLEPGKLFRRTFKSGGLTAEVSETAAISFKDGSRFTITANVWQRP